MLTTRNHLKKKEASIVLCICLPDALAEHRAIYTILEHSDHLNPLKVIRYFLLAPKGLCFAL